MDTIPISTTRKREPREWARGASRAIEGPCSRCKLLSGSNSWETLEWTRVAFVSKQKTNRFSKTFFTPTMFWSEAQSRTSVMCSLLSQWSLSLFRSISCTIYQISQNTPTGQYTAIVGHSILTTLAWRTNQKKRSSLSNTLTINKSSRCEKCNYRI